MVTISSYGRFISSKIPFINQRNFGSMSYSRFRQLKSFNDKKLVLSCNAKHNSNFQNNKDYTACQTNCINIQVRSISSFPSFSTNNYEGFVPTPTMKVAADIIIWGSPNKTDISSSITKKLEQSPEALLEGSLMAVEAATEMIVHSLDMNRDIYPKVDRDSIDLKEFLTEKCHNSVFDSYTSILSDGKKINLISTPKEDIFFAWIERLQEAPDGTLSMKVCTMSFPTYGEILQGLKNNRKIQEEFMKDLEDQTKDGKKLAEDVKAKLEKTHNSLYDPRQFVKENDMVISNFVFKRGSEKEDSWLIDNISMQAGKQALSKIAEFRWRGRMNLSFRFSMKKLVRIDFTTDYLVLLFLFYVAIAFAISPL